MDFRGIVRSLSISQLIKLFGIAITKFTFFFCFMKATKDCIRITTEHFGNDHHKNNVGNAFRHALWNMLITLYSIEAGKSIERSIDWAKYITDWHEDAFKNSPLERAMDLHNNQVGRNWFINLHEEGKPLKSRDTIVSYLLNNVDKGIHITSLEETKSMPNRLVFIDK